MNCRTWICLWIVLVSNAVLHAEVPDPSQLKLEEWAANGMTQDPVALAFDGRGRLFVVESARRSTVDIDIRAHRTWLLDDLASDDFESMRAFFRRQMATTKSDKNKSWLKDRNQDGVHDYRDLMTISERIRLLEDTDGDGRADKSTVYAEGFNEEFTGVAAGVMPYDGDVFMTVYPDLWKLRDLDGDGRSDGRVALFRGFGVHAAFDGHDLHGLTVGPEGKIYFSCGDNGFSVLTREGQRLHYPNTGGVLRMNPDGSNLEVFAIGLRNVQEFDFDQYGNMFGVDNDGDLEDERERAVYIAEGSDAGWRLNWQFRAPGWAEHNGGMTYNPWTAEGMWKPQHEEQPAYITPPMQNYSVGPGGFKFNPGTALNPQYQDFFFCVQFPVQKITAFRTESVGAGFRMVDEHLFHGGLMVSSLNFGPDGAIYLADWVGKWQPNGEGVVYRVDDPARRGSADREQVATLLRHGVADRSTKLLTEELLGHSDRRVRQLAQFELVRRRKGFRLFQVATNSKASQLARVHALWGLLQLDDPQQRRWLGSRLPWKDKDAQIRQQCARVAGDLQLPGSGPSLIKLLSDTAPLVRSHASIALGKLRDDQAVPALAILLAENNDQDPFLRHGAVMGLAGCAAPRQLAEFANHTEPAVRMGATLALRRQRSKEIEAFLADESLRVRREAVRGIHDDLSIPDALPAVARLLEAPLPLDEPMLRRMLSANLRVGDGDCASRLVQFVLQAQHDLGPLGESMREEAIRCLGAWEQHPLVDRVEGRVRKSQRTNIRAARESLVAHWDQLLQIESTELTTALAEIAVQLSLPVDTARMKAWVLSEEQPDHTRIAALRLLQHQGEPLLSIVKELLPTSWSQPTPLERAAFGWLVDNEPDEAVARVDLTAPMPARRFFFSQLGKLNNPQAAQLLEEALRELNEVEVLPGIALDVLTAARQSGKKSLQRIVESLETRLNDHPWGEYQLSLDGGDPQRGEALYRGHVQAQCIRCHDAGGKGKQAGPVLQGIAGRVKTIQLLEALVDPTATIAQGFETTSLVLDDGQVLHGTVIQEDEQTVLLGTQQGKTTQVDKTAIEERLPQRQSAMPNMRDVLTPLEVRDLVAYLKTLK